MTADARAYPEIDEKNLKLIPDSAQVFRAFALNAQKHLAFRNKYPVYLALPDKWQSWIVSGVLRGVMQIYRQNIPVILSTYPIASAHVIGYVLHRITRRPWVADFRDPMVQGQYPQELKTRRAFQYIERAVFKYAARVIVVSNGTKEFYRRKFPDYPEGKIQVVENGYDEEVFRGVVQESNPEEERITVLHSGILYNRERNPASFLTALSELQKAGFWNRRRVRFVFRAAGNEEQYRSILKTMKLEHMVEFEPSISYGAALSELFSADALLVCQGTMCDGQIPAKVYEYLYAGRSVIGLCNPSGDTGNLLRSIGCPYIAPLEDAREIMSCLERFFQDFQSSTNWKPNSHAVRQFSRRRGAEKIAGILSEL